MENGQNPNFNFTVGANWDQQKEQLKQQYPQLTDADLQFEQGQEQELFSSLERKLNKNPEEINRIFNQLNSQNPSDFRSNDNNPDDGSETSSLF
jgi:uncharacterized protein YjbJ (UPF0337 family)